MTASTSTLAGVFFFQSLTCPSYQAAVMATETPADKTVVNHKSKLQLPSRCNGY
jgi:hypothetical protein